MLSTKEVELIRRCQYGMSLATYLSLFEIDLTLQAEEVRARVINILRKCLPFLDESLLYIQKCASIGKLQNLTCIVDLFWNSFRKFLSSGNSQKAKDILQNCAQIVDNILPPLDPDASFAASDASSLSRNSASKRLNDMSFLLLITDASNGILRTTIGNSMGENVEGIKSDFRKLIPNDQSHNLFPRTSKPSKVIKFNINSEQSTSRPTLVIPGPRKSVTMTTQLKANIEAHVVKCMPPYKPTNTASMMKNLSVTSRNSVPMKFKMQLPEASVVGLSATTPEPEFMDTESIAGSTMAIPASLVDNSIKPKRAAVVKPKKVPKGGNVVVETEDQKSKRLILSELIEVLRCFEGDAAKLGALTNGLEMLTCITKSNETTINDLKSIVSGYLLDLGFELLTTPPNTLVEKGGVLSTLVGEAENITPANPALYNIGRLPSLREISHLIEELQFARFNHDELMEFCRYLFKNSQWERFVVIAQVLEHHLSDKVFMSDEPETFKKMGSELTLRAAIINFHNIWHSERKVLFQTDDDLSGTAEDLRWKKLEVPAALHDASAALLHSMSDCLEFKQLIIESYELFLGCTKLLWSFVEPFIHEYFLLDDMQLATEIRRDDIILRIVKSIHLIVSEFPDKEIEFGIMASLQLTDILEKINALDEAIFILEQTAARITESRGDLGEGPGSLEIIATHAGIQSEHHWNKLGPKELIKLTVPCLEIEVYKSLFRCDMKKRYGEAVEYQNKRKEEYERLTKKIMKPKPIASHPSESYAHFMCGENIVLKSILLMVYASNGQNLSIVERHNVLLAATSYLKNQVKIEKSLLKDMSKESHISSKSSSMRCPMPTIIRRTPTSITIRPNHMISDTGHLLVPTSYQGFCKEFGAGKVALNDTDYPGSGESVKATNNAEITIFGLEPNKRYMFAVAAFDESGQIMGRGIGETSKGTTTMYSLPLIYCWCNISIVSHDLCCDDVADMGFNTAWSHFVASTCSDSELSDLGGPSSTGVLHPKTFKLYENNVALASTELKRLFVHCIHKKIDRKFAQIDPAIHSNANGTRNTLNSQMTRLKAARMLLVAAEVSTIIEDHELTLSTATKIMYCLFPFFQLGIESPFAVHATILAHSYILKCESNKAFLESTAIIEIFGPLITLLVQGLINWKEFPHALSISEDTLKYLNVRGGNFDSTVIVNSAAVELQWTGIVPRTKRYTTNQRKNLLLNIQSDNLHQVIVAVSSNHGIGYNQSRKKIEILRESFEFTICHCQLMLRPVIPFERRYLEPSTTLKDIYHMYICCGAEALSTELLKFKKNPRYLELMTNFMQWNFSKGNMESTVKIISDVMEWVSLRNRFISHAYDIMEDVVDAATKDVIFHRKKRSLFAEKKTISLDFGAKQERKSRAKHRQPKNINSLVDGGITRDKSKNQIEDESSPAPPSRNGGSASRPTSKERRNSSKSRSPSAERTSKDAKEVAAGLRGIGRKRKKLAQRNILLAGLGQLEKDRLEKSVKCLDAIFGRFWKQKRLAKRLRIVIKFESRWKSELAFILAVSNFKKLDNELCGRNLVSLLQNQSTRVDFNKLYTGFGHTYENNPLTKLLYPEVSTQCTPTPIVEPETTKLVSDILQSFVQSIVLAARVKLWGKVVDGCRAMWNATQSLVKSGYISQEFRETFLWKPFFIAGDYLLDMLESTKIVVDVSVMEEPLSGRCLPPTPSEDEIGKVGNLPFSTYEQLATRDFLSLWTNSYGDDEKCRIHLPWCVNFLFYGFDCMLLAKMPKRAMTTVNRLNTIFKGVYADWCTDFMRRSDQVEALKNSKVVTDVYTSLSHARKSFSEFVSAKMKNVQSLEESLALLGRFTEAFENYDAALKSAEKYGRAWPALVCNEYGDLWYANGDVKEAVFYWSKCIDVLFDTDHMVNSWKMNIQQGDSVNHRLGGIKNVVFAGSVILKLSKFGTIKDLEKNKSLILFATHLFLSAMKGSLPHPNNALIYADYTPMNIAPFLNLFSDKYVVDPLLLTNLLVNLATELLLIHLPNEALIISAFVSYIGADVLMDDWVFTQLILLKSRILMEMGFVKQSLEKLSAVFSGTVLLQNRHFQSCAELPFSSTDSIYLQSNWQIIKTLAEMKLNETSKRIYGLSAVQQIELSRTVILIRLLKLNYANDPVSGNPIYNSLFSTSVLRTFDNIPTIPEVPGIYPMKHHDPSRLTNELPTTAPSTTIAGAVCATGSTGIAELGKSNTSVNLSSDMLGKQTLKFVSDCGKSFSGILQIFEENIAGIMDYCKSRMTEDMKLNTGTDLAKVLAGIGISEALDFKSKTYELKLRGQLLMSEISLTKSDELYSSILDFQRLIAQEKKLLSRCFVLAECWNLVGDMISIITPDRHEPLAMAYDQADEFLAKFLQAKSGYPIPQSSHSPYYALKAIIKFKRTLHYRAISNMPEAHKLIIETVLLGYQTRQAIPPSLRIRMFLTLADAMYRNNQHGITVKTHAQTREDVKRIFTDALVTEISAGGTDYSVLRTSFEGLLAIAIEEGDEFTARRLSHCLSHVAYLENKSICQKYDDIPGIEKLAFNLTSDSSSFMAAEVYSRAIAKSLTLDVFCSESQFPDFEVSLQTCTVASILSARQELISSRNPFSICTTDTFHQILEIRLRNYNSYLASLHIATAFAQSLCMSNIMFGSLAVHSSIDITTFPRTLQAPFNPNTKQMKQLVQQACIQWLNLPVRVIEGEGEAMNDRLWNLVVCFAVPPQSEEEKRATPTNRSAGTRRSSNAGRAIGSAKSRGDIVQLARPLSSRRASALVLVTPENSGAKVTVPYPLYTTKVPESIIKLVLEYTNSTVVSLKKFRVTKDEKYMKMAETAFENVLHTIIVAVSKQEIDVSATTQRPVLSEPVLENIRRMFTVSEGFTSRTADDAAIFLWIQSLLSFVRQ
ncbi:UNVERIFIED_CONTAM: hypothetical protein HDU68_008632 [Siphonaria sp. JEL0065]|nr:hypothetical protein HDU68_008632 [Siphonaria sp. JEL0065]